MPLLSTGGSITKMHSEIRMLMSSELACFCCLHIQRLCIYAQNLQICTALLYAAHRFAAAAGILNSFILLCILVFARPSENSGTVPAILVMLKPWLG